MKHIIIAPDSFKGTMSSIEVCDGIAKAFARVTDAPIIQIPIADGGEGSLDCVLQSAGGRRITCTVNDAYGRPMQADYAIVDGDATATAVIEMAQCAGLPLVADCANPELTTTYGVGELIADALGRGCKRITLALGGSSTNDGGAGLAAALGAVFTDRDGKSFIPTGGTLKDIAHIDVSGVQLHGARITAMCDVNNPLYGTNGAAYIYARQKGADDEMIRRLDEGLQWFARRIREDVGICVEDIPGGGAAGGMGAGTVALLGGTLRSGIDTVLDMTGFDALLQRASFVITGEGRFDSQSLSGKVIHGVAKRAKAAGVPVIVLAGDVCLDDMRQAYDAGICAVHSINRVAVPFGEAKLRCKDDLYACADAVARTLYHVCE